MITSVKVPPGFAARLLAFFIPVAAALTVVAALVYGAVQTDYRTSANDPQMQMATDATLRLDGGTRPAEVAKGPTVDLTRSLAPHTTVYGSHGVVLASNARLDGTVPTPPAGVTASVSGHDMDQHWLTWQPRSGVRVAAVVTGWREGSVLVGRSLAQVENRETGLELFVLAAWLAGLALLAAAAALAAWIWPIAIPPTSR